MSAFDVVLGQLARIANRNEGLGTTDVERAKEGLKDALQQMIDATFDADDPAARAFWEKVKAL